MEKKLSLRELQEFTDRYFTKDCPRVRWQRVRGRTMGIANWKKNTIMLDPEPGAHRLDAEE